MYTYICSIIYGIIYGNMYSIVYTYMCVTIMYHILTTNYLQVKTCIKSLIKIKVKYM